MTSELQQLIEEQAKDMRHGHRVFPDQQGSRTVLHYDGWPSGVDAPRPKLLASDDGHGTKLHYYTVYGCRCDKCKALSAATKRRWYAKNRKKPPRPYKYVQVCKCCGSTDVRRKRVYLDA